jgi:hypothetical protein
MNRLKGEALTRAISHMGTHITDIRSAQNAAGANLYATEYHAWQTTVLSALASRQNTLTLPGGYLAWNTAWPSGDRSKMVDDAVSKYLMDWAALKK